MKTQTTQPDLYNGWENYFTWAININMNDGHNVAFWQDRARHLDDVQDLADEIKDYYTGNTPLTQSGVYTDLLDGALTSVDWLELAARIMDDI